MIHWPHCFGPVVTQDIMALAHGERSLFTSWLGEKERRERA
jgi:hypothetical protein